MLRALIIAAVSIWIVSSAQAGVGTGKEAVAKVRSAYPDLAVGLLEEMSSRAEVVYARLSAFFGRSLPQPIIIDLSDNYDFSTSFPHINLIGFPRHIIESGMAVLAHEMAHLFMTERRSAVLSEGIAIYVQDRFGMARGYPNFGIDVDELLMHRVGGIEGLRRISLLHAERTIAGHAGGRNRRTAYLMAGSFTRYLFDEILKQDVAAFRRLYMRGEYAAETGKTLAALESAWRRHLGFDPAPAPL